MGRIDALLHQLRQRGLEGLAANGSAVILAARVQGALIASGGRLVSRGLSGIVLLRA